MNGVKVIRSGGGGVVIGGGDNSVATGAYSEFTQIVNSEQKIKLKQTQIDELVKKIAQLQSEIIQSNVGVMEDKLVAQLMGAKIEARESKSMNPGFLVKIVDGVKVACDGVKPVIDAACSLQDFIKNF